MKINRIRVIKDALLAFALIGVVAGGMRLWFGLGATTNLSDAVPWGLWKILNMVGGVALSTSGFTVGFLVYVLRLERFRPLMKPAILIAFLGYGCSCLALLFDIGLPHRFWHPIFMWNINSFLFEVFWCVLLYFTVTAIELAPTIFEKLRAERLVRNLHRIAFGVVVVGISLSSLHHSSLGSLFLVTPYRLHSLWYTPLLPILFIVSAMGAGIMVVVLLRILWASLYEPEPIFGRPPGKSIASGDHSPLFDVPFIGRKSEGVALGPVRHLAIIGAAILGVYLVLKILDLYITGSWSELFKGTWESWLYLFELSLTATIPVAILLSRRLRNSPYALGVAAFCAAAGLALNRLDVGIFGYFRDAETVYFPSLVEWAVGTGVVAAAGLVFLVVSEHFPIFRKNQPRERISSGFVRVPYGNLRQLWYSVVTDDLHRITLIAVLVIPVAFVLFYPPYDRGETGSAVQASLGIDAERKILRIDGNRAGIMTIFPHADHQKRLGDSTSCHICHHISIPHDHATPCSRCHRNLNSPTQIFEHSRHSEFVVESEKIHGWQPKNRTCAVCHVVGKPKTATSVKDCFACHEKDMFQPGTADSTVNLLSAPAFSIAMHKKCAECHAREAEKQNRPELGYCHTCHQSLRPRQFHEAQFAVGADLK